ncbi:MAG: TonB-dependent receptor [Cephaloticoccus sp.]|nr:TonB-dependent receptor [Cephaloticoccus sp.]MCF7759338.1 TonB-dependent receptor [Cephaloticoccus sp.]
MTTLFKSVGCRLVFTAVFLLGLLTSAQAADEGTTKSYDLPAADATTAFQSFTEQSGHELIYPATVVAGVKTQAVKGEFTALEALNHMLAGTELVAVQDKESGAFAVNRVSDPNGQRVAQQNSDHPGVTEDAGQKAVRLERYEVLGSRIRQTEDFSPSPVSTYDNDFIRSSGALTLADFLSRLPQNYAGVSAGRGSTPNELNPEFGSRTETATPPFNLALGVSAVRATATGQSGVGLRGLGAGSTLVLVDGRRVAQSSAGNAGTDSRQGFVDLNTIPLGMVERIEVITDGASAIYGADAVAGVVNIVLKKNWSGSELSANYKGAFAGGGHERSISLIHGFNYGPLHGTLSLDFYQRADLKADQRVFSNQQDHTGIVEGFDPTTGAWVYGSNFLLNYGYPATVQARSGNLSGITANGVPTRVALTPGGLTSDPTTTAGFVGVAPVGTATLAAASKARLGNTAEFLDLIPPSERQGISLSLGYTLPNSMELYSRYSYSDVKSSFSSQPAVFNASASTGFGNFASIVPAAYNPFGQDVLVGMIVYDFGSIVQTTKTTADNAVLGLRGSFGETWQWDLSAGWQEQDFSRVVRDFNYAAITAALANPDASQRFNPFVDSRASGAPDQSALLATMARYITFEGVSRMRTLDFIADGGVFELTGGMAKMAAGFSYQYDENSGTSVTPSVAVTPVLATVTTGGNRKTTAVFSELSIPIFGKGNARPGFERLNLQIAGRYEDRSDAGSVTVPKVGFTWTPVKPVMLRASYSEGFRAPSLTEYQQIVGNTFTSNTVVDPKRGNTVTRGVVVTRGANPNLKPETSKSEFYGVVVEPPQAKGLTFQVNYYRTTQENIIQVLTEQQLVNNEAFFPDRVTRTAPTATDIANGWAGAVIGADRSLLNFGKVINHSLDFSTDYRLPWEEVGRWRVGFNASRTLKSEREVRPGEPAVEDLGDTLSPPEWRMSGSLFWTKGPLNASLFVNYLSSFDTNTAGNTRSPLAIPSQKVVDVRMGYEFQKGVVGEYLKGSRLSFGIGNLLDEQPPFSDTVFGYNGALHSPLGRTYELSLSCPF